MPDDVPSPREPVRASSAPDAPFDCELHATGRGAAWVSAHGELDLDSAPRLEQILEQALDHALLVIVDLRRLTFIDSCGIRVLLDADERAQVTGHRLVMIRGSEPVGQLLELLGLTDRLRLVDRSSAPPAVASGPVRLARGAASRRAVTRLLAKRLRRRENTMSHGGLVDTGREASDGTYTA